MGEKPENTEFKREDRYTCVGKGGDYELIGLAQGAGNLRGFNHMVYRNRDGVMFVREAGEFSVRMEKLPEVPGHE